MVKHSRRWQKTNRDDDILAALDLAPLTAEQILKLSQIWHEPFSSLRRVQERLKLLTTVGQLRSWRYATTGPTGSTPLYYKLSPAGYRTRHADPDARPPTKRYLAEVGPGRHRHQFMLSQFIVHVHTAAALRGLSIVDFAPENTLRLQAGERWLYPDASFSIAGPAIAHLPFHIELDNSTESIWSQRDTDSIEHKLRGYQLHRTLTGHRYRVLFVVTGHPHRLQHIIHAADRLIPSADFAPVYATRFDDFLRYDDALFQPCFTAPRHDHIALLRSQSRHCRSLTTPLVSVPSVC